MRIHSRCFPLDFMKYPSEQTHCPSCPERGSHFESDGQSAVIWQTLLVPEIIWEILESQRIYAQVKSAEFSQKSRELYAIHSRRHHKSKLCDRTEEMEIVWKKNTRLELEIFSSHTQQRALDGFLIFFFSAILFFSPKCLLARAVCCLLFVVV